MTVIVCVSLCLYAALWKGIPVLTAAFGYYDDVVSLVFIYNAFGFFCLNTSFLLRVVVKLTSYFICTTCRISF